MEAKTAVSPVDRQGRHYPKSLPLLSLLRYGLVVRIAGSHPAGPGSIPGTGTLFFNFLVGIKKNFLKNASIRWASKGFFVSHEHIFDLAEAQNLE